jgi:DNA (cytosine-5)-methyltransferase 1
MIGGPPCQAYSVIGRSRNKGISGYTAEKDKRSYLYRQYLRLIAQHKPDFFIMENVKGILSAKLNGKSLFEKIIDDLQRPQKAIQKIGKISTLEYQIFPLVQNTASSTKPADFIAKTEDYGIPQARHRVILIGVRNGFSATTPATLKKQRQITVKEVLCNLPKLRSGLSKGKKEITPMIAGLKSYLG